MNVLSLTTLASATTPSTWNPVAGIRTSILDSTNPQFLRSIRLDGTALVLSINNAAVQPVILPISEFLAACAAANPALSWPPLVVSQPANLTVATPSGTTFHFGVTSETAITYQWQVSLNAGFSWTNVVNNATYSGATSSTLSISNSTGFNGNHYQCIATNASGSTTSNGLTNGIFTVLPDPSFTVQPKSVNVTHPFGATFTVQAVIDSSPLYQWQLSTDSGVTWNNLANGGVYSGVLGPSMTVGNSTGLNGNQYRCIITDTAGTATSNAAILTVL